MVKSCSKSYISNTISHPNESQVNRYSLDNDTEVKKLKVDVVKFDEELGIVFGYAIVCDVGDEIYIDTQNDHIPEDTMLKATSVFMQGDRPALDMHQGSAIGQIVYGFPLTDDIAKALDIQISQTGFIVGMRVDDEDVLEKFKMGEYSGFSIGGRRVIDTEVAA